MSDGIDKKVVTIHYKMKSGEIYTTKSPVNDLVSVFCKISIGNLSELSFTDCILDANDINFICPLISPTLSNLDVSHLGLTSKSIKILAKKLQNVSLEKLDLSNNPIGDESVWMLLEVFGKKESLKSLNLSNCNLSGQALFPLLNTISTKEFNELNISNNHVGYVGAGYIQTYFQFGPKIKKFSARNCGFSSAEVESIISSFHRVPNSEVDLTKNQPIPPSTLAPNFKVDMHSMV